MKENYPNFKALILLSTCFLFLFIGFNIASNTSTKSLRDNEFANLGYYSQSLLYLSFCFGSIIAPQMIRRFSPNTAMLLASFTYALWIVSLALTTYLLRNTDFTTTQITVIVLMISFLCGFGPSLLWVAQGKYLSDCCQEALDKKGFYSAIFVIMMCFSQILSSLWSAFLIEHVVHGDTEKLFMIAVFISLISSVLFAFALPKNITKQTE